MTAQGTPGTLPTAIGKYRIERVLGRGAMGVVYLGRDPTIDRPVAIKIVVLPDGLDAHKIAEFRERFLREARAAGRLSHPAIVTVYEADDGSASGVPFIAMEYVEGLPWNYKVRQGIKQDPDAILPLFREIASALDYAHKNGVVHRDIKPANIVQTPDGHVKLMDFGIAKVPTSELTREGQFLGTPAYMSPEQVMGRPVDGRADLFSLGTVLYELLTCKKPFPGEDISTVTYRIARDEPEPLLELNPSLPPEVVQMVRHLLEKDPQRRYATAGEFVEDIDAYMAGAALPHAGTALDNASAGVAEPTLVANGPKALPPKGAPAPVRTPPPLAPTPRRRLPLAVAVGGALLGLVVLGAVVLGAAALWSKARSGGPTGQTAEPAPVASQTPATTPQEAPPGPASPPAAPASGGTVQEPKETQPVQPVKPRRPPPPKTEPKPENAVPVRPAEPATHPAVKPPEHALVAYTFTSKILKGGFKIKVDGKDVVARDIQRKFTLKDETYTGTFTVPPGPHEVSFEIQTDIQNVSGSHAESRTFEAGQRLTLNIRMTRLNKELSFAWVE
ncbi:MAG: serine/threonine protein kinase [Acidobacteriota bacterium]